MFEMKQHAMPRELICNDRSNKVMMTMIIYPFFSHR